MVLHKLEGSNVIMGYKRKEGEDVPEWDANEEVTEMSLALYTEYRNRWQSVVDRGTKGGRVNYKRVPQVEKDTVAYFERVFQNLQWTLESKSKKRRTSSGIPRALTMEDMTPQVMQLWKIAQEAKENGLELSSEDIRWDEGADRSGDPLAVGEQQDYGIDRVVD